MEVTAGLASITQLVAYSICAVRVLTKLHSEIQSGPTLWQQQESNIRHLLKVTSRISKRQPFAQDETAKHITVILSELAEIALKALKLILEAKRPGFLGICWSAISSTNTLTRLFESLGAKRDILHLVLSETVSDPFAVVHRSKTSGKRSTGKMSQRPIIVFGDVVQGDDSLDFSCNGLEQVLLQIAQAGGEFRMGSRTNGNGSVSHTYNSGVVHHTTLRSRQQGGANNFSFQVNNSSNPRGDAYSRSNVPNREKDYNRERNGLHRDTSAHVSATFNRTEIFSRSFNAGLSRDAERIVTIEYGQHHTNNNGDVSSRISNERNEHGIGELGQGIEPDEDGAHTS